jgi:hypothetical protein
MPPDEILLTQKACWAVQAERTKSHYVVDAVGRSNITEVSLDTTSLKFVPLVKLLSG